MFMFMIVFQLVMIGFKITKQYVANITCAGLVKHCRHVLFSFDWVQLDWYCPLVPVLESHYKF